MPKAVRKPDGHKGGTQASRLLGPHGIVREKLEQWTCHLYGYLDHGRIFLEIEGLVQGG